MKLLLTSSGIRNASIEGALIECDPASGHASSIETFRFSAD